VLYPATAWFVLASLAGMVVFVLHLLAQPAN
jgi:hypothetical protein